jgi:LDH2 family malate/lactate/ureidoglycolate dehydrogenase
MSEFVKPPAKLAAQTADRGKPQDRFSPAELTAVARRVLASLGVPGDLADGVSGSLVRANLLGHDSHGIWRLLQYAPWILSGQIVPDAYPDLSHRAGATAVIDGRWGLGQPAAKLAARTAADFAGLHGVSAVAIARCNHIGRLGEYVADLAEAGCVGLAFCNSGPVVAPAGGTRRTFGTNPFAWAAPVSAGAPVVLDFSTAGIAEGKLRVALASGDAAPDGVLIDVSGRPTTSPQDFYDGGALLPFGGHKGSGLAFMIELVGGLLTGMGTAPMPGYAGGNGTVLIALSIDAFTDLSGFADAAALFGARVTEAVDGSREPRVFLPGQVEARTAAERAVSGIPVPDAIRRDITALASSRHVSLGRFGLA